MANGSGLERFLGGSPLGVLVRLVLLSIVVGVIMAALGLDAFSLIDAVLDFLEGIFGNGLEALKAAGRYFLIGAAVVVPIWLILRILASLRRN